MYQPNLVGYVEKERRTAAQYTCGVGHFYHASVAMLSMVYAIVVCLSVCVSVTLQYCIKTAKLESQK